MVPSGLNQGLKHKVWVLMFAIIPIITLNLNWKQIIILYKQQVLASKFSSIHKHSMANDENDVRNIVYNQNSNAHEYFNFTENRQNTNLVSGSFL